MAFYDKTRRSQAAKLGWETRRIKKVQEGTMSFEKLYAIYGEYALEIMPEAWKYIDAENDNNNEEKKEAYEKPDFEYEEEEYTDERYLDMYEISQERIKSILSESGYNVYSAVEELSNDIKQSLPLEKYKRFFVDSLPTMDEYFGIYMYPWDEEDETNNVLGKIIDIASDYGYSGTVFQYSSRISQLVKEDWDLYDKVRKKK